MSSTFGSARCGVGSHLAAKDRHVRLQRGSRPVNDREGVLSSFEISPSLPLPVLTIGLKPATGLSPLKRALGH